MAQCIVNYWGLEVIRTDFIALCCKVPNGNLQGLPKHLNGHPRVSEQNLVPQNMAWRTREASRPPGCWKDHGFDPQTPHHKPIIPTHQPHTTGGEGGRGVPQDPKPEEENDTGLPTLPDHLGGCGGGGRGARDHIYVLYLDVFVCLCTHVHYVHMCVYMYIYIYLYA